ncbi:trans-sialidase, putative [Trypanosoma cruzi marinkellei]|uniref:Trans-sialidase, putative n=1 Tax=Trypanosoma cruzi marinkellei TaxID=85056 RepID=K2MM39_TRYCR|nr:trans-sialidase, putative [Trypanosoma cruzi marinkellei]
MTVDFTAREQKRSEGGSHGRVAFARGGGAGAGKRGGEEMDSFGQRLAIMRSYCQGWLGAAAKGMCTGPVPTKGLVVFLSGSSTGTEWRDEYLGVDAIIKNTAAAVNGVTLKGAGAGAQWPVDTQGRNVPHYVANREFTLAATVSIYEVPESGNVPLVSVGMNDPNSTLLFGLSYTHEKKWCSMTPSNTNPDEPALFEWKPNTT